MEEYSIRVNQLKRLKLSIILKLILLSLLCIGISIGLYFLYQYVIKNIINFNYEHFEEDILHGFFTFGYIVLMLLINSLIWFIYYSKANHRYRDTYYEYLFSESKLEEIYLFDNKISSLKFSKSYLKDMLKFKKIKLISTFSDASSKFRLNITNIRYQKKDRTKHFGVLFSVSYDQEKPGFLQITRDRFPSIESYEGHSIVQYGFAIKSVLREYHMFSTLGTDSYLLENNQYGEKIILISKFFKREIELIFDNDELYLLVPDYRIKLIDSVFQSISHVKFADKLSAIKKIHEYFFDLIKMFDEIFVTKA